MKMQTFDSRTGRLHGEIDIPDDIVEAAARVASWMKTNNCTQLCSLQLAGQRDQEVGRIIG